MKSLLQKIIKRIAKRQLNYAFHKIQTIKPRYIHLDLIEHHLERLMVEAFTQILQFSKPKLTISPHSAPKQSKILPLFLVKIVKNYQEQYFNEIKCNCLQSRSK